MAHKTFRCWFKDGTARLITQDSHHDAAMEAQELAGLDNADIRRDDDEGRRLYYNATRVVKTECLTDGSVEKWKA